MTVPMNELDRYLSSDEVKKQCAEIDAELRSGAGSHPVVEWADPPPDPFGQNWAWMTSAPAALESTAPGAISDRRTQSARPGPARYVGYAAGAALAASLLLAFGVFVGQRGQNQAVALSAKISARQGEVRGPGRVVDLTVENTTTRDAFVTVVGLAGARSPVHYETGKSFIRLGPKQTTSFELPAPFDGLLESVVVLTPTPAGEAVLKIAEEGVLPGDPTAARAVLSAGLTRYGFTDAAVESVRLTP